MISALQDIRDMGLKTPALTNNFPTAEPVSDESASALTFIRSHFDVVVESAKEGVRKPDPKIYQTVLSRLALPPERCVFLDDISANLRAAARLGMHTIKVATV